MSFFSVRTYVSTFTNIGEYFAWIDYGCIGSKYGILEDNEWLWRQPQDVLKAKWPFLFWGGEEGNELKGNNANHVNKLTYPVWDLRWGEVFGHNKFCPNNRRFDCLTKSQTLEKVFFCCLTNKQCPSSWGLNLNNLQKISFLQLSIGTIFSKSLPLKDFRKSSPPFWLG